MTDIVIVPTPNLNESVKATIVDSTGVVRRFVQCPRGVLHLQAGDGETLIERQIARGKRWDFATEQEVDAPQPPAPADAFEFDAIAWRWISKGEKNGPIIRRMELLERAQDRAVREYLLGDMGQVEMRVKLRLIDNAIIELRNQLIA